ncbi:MAG: hypothetical protein FWC45_09700 [Treponema sp.]|nr:hypothetical protein [Treponema sp.]
MFTTSYERDNSFLDNTTSQKADGINIDETADIHPNVYMEGEITIGKYVQIEAGVVLLGKITIGDYTVIRCNCSIRGGIKIGKNVQIFEHVNIEGGRGGNYVGSNTCLVDDKAIISDNCMIGAGTVMHGTQIGEGTIIGMRCACDYNTRFGKGAVLANGSGTMFDSIYPDNCFIAGVEGQIISCNISDAERNAYVGYEYKRWLGEMSSKLEYRYKNGMRLANMTKMTNLKIHETAYIHPTAILEGNIEVGEYTEVGPGCILCGDIKIGSHVWMCINSVIKGGVTIGDFTHVYDNTLIDGSIKPDVDVPLANAIRRVSIGNRCWINHGCMIRGSMEEKAVVHLSAAVDYGCKLMEGAIIGGCSAIKSGDIIPAYCMAEGVPAKVVYTDIRQEDRNNYLGVDTVGFSTQMGEWLEQKSGKREPTIKRNLTLAKTAFVHPKAWLEGDITVGKYTIIEAGSILVGNITIGDYTYIAINCALRGTIKIGNNNHLYDQVNVEGGRGKVCFDAGTAFGSGEDSAITGDNCWLNHGAVMHGTHMEDCSAAHIGSACDYNTHLCKGAVLAKRSYLRLDLTVPANVMVSGSPAIEIKKFLTNVNRSEYFGLIPEIYTIFAEGHHKARIEKMKKHK